MVEEDEYHSRCTSALIEYWSNDAWSIRCIVEIVPFVSPVRLPRFAPTAGRSFFTLVIADVSLRHVVFDDMGFNSAYAALVYFSAYTTKEYGKSVSVNQSFR